MNIGGFQKTTLIDYPDRLSAIIWTNNCNFKCPFCYNKDLVFGNSESINKKDILDYLEIRKGLIEGLVISGGEPFLQNDLIDFIREVKEIGYLIKIDTNGTFPKKILELIDEKLVDYIAMDIKAPKSKYNKLSGVKIDISIIQESIDIIKNNCSEYEFRTTYIPKYLKKQDIIEIGKWLEGSKKFYLQQFQNTPDLVSADFKLKQPYPKEYLIETLEAIKQYFNFCDIR
jgi:pyruvate formate lyase activating enzyme